MKRIAIIDYGMGNLHSVQKALQKVAADQDVCVSTDAETIGNADRVVLPGVGAIRDCMAELEKLEFDRVVKDLVRQGTPLLGICVGMQMLAAHSEENGGIDGLGLIDAKVKRFTNRPGSAMKVPHMGWNEVEQRGSHPLWQGIVDRSRFYFVHSFYVAADIDDLTAAYCDYGERFVAAVQRENLFATQFHPEKSQHDGLQLLQNFSRWNGRA